jgi:O-antigen ligase
MGYYVALLYMVLLILSPAEVLPALAPYRIQVLIGGLAALLTAALLPIRGFPLRAPQPYLLAGFLFAIMASWLAQGSIHGARMGVFKVGSACIVFYLFVAGVQSLRRIKIIAGTLVILACYMVLRGILAFHYRIEYPTYVFEQPYFFEIVQRIRYVGEFSDPNDLAQYFLVSLPFVGMLWRRGQIFRNLIITLPLMAYIGYGIFLTHSRGVFVGLLAVLMLHLRTRFNSILMTIAAAVVAVVGLAGMIAGGRAFSFGAGADRIEAWGVGLGLLRSHPITGAGFNSFTDFHEITAHNSFVLCFAELGLLGFFFWMALIVCTFLQLNALIRQHRQNPAMADAVRWALAIRLSLTGFLTTAWFLSRTYIVLLWVLLAMAVSLIEIAKSAQARVAPAPQPGPAPGRLQPVFSEVRWLPATAAFQFGCLFFVYVLVRKRWAGG